MLFKENCQQPISIADKAFYANIILDEEAHFQHLPKS